jgi:hypothetical protein
MGGVEAMILEQLTFAVHPSVLKDWLKFEEDEWLPWLRQQRGFMHKQIDCGGGLATNKIWWKDKQSWDEAAQKKEEMVPKNMKMHRLFGSKVIMVRAN